FDRAALADDLRAAGVAVALADSVDDALDRARALLRPDDVAVTMSSGSFDGLPQRLLAALGAAADA
ncbi:MAG: hypothetical protein AAF772_08070, partial [Acidobacteriota bacterium]